MHAQEIKNQLLMIKFGKLFWQFPRVDTPSLCAVKKEQLLFSQRTINQLILDRLLTCFSLYRNVGEIEFGECLFT